MPADPLRSAASLAAENIRNIAFKNYGWECPKRADMRDAIKAAFAPLAERLAQLERDNLMLVQERAKLREACERIMADYKRIGEWGLSGEALDLCRAALADHSCGKETKSA